MKMKAVFFVLIRMKMSWWEDDPGPIESSADIEKAILQKRKVSSLKSLTLEKLFEGASSLHSILEQVSLHPGILNASLECEDFWSRVARVATSRMYSLELFQKSFRPQYFRRDDIQKPIDWYRYCLALDEGLIYQLAVKISIGENWQRIFDRKVISYFGHLHSFGTNKVLHKFPIMILGSRPVSGTKGIAVNIEMNTTIRITEKHICVVGGDREESLKQAKELACFAIWEELRDMKGRILLSDADRDVHFDGFPRVRHLYEFWGPRSGNLFWNISHADGDRLGEPQDVTIDLFEVEF